MSLTSVLRVQPHTVEIEGLSVNARAAGPLRIPRGSLSVAAHLNLRPLPVFEKPCRLRQRAAFLGVIANSEAIC